MNLRRGAPERETANKKLTKIIEIGMMIVLSSKLSSA
jgi:hypothetical protein